MGKTRKAQISMEYLAIFAIAALMTLPLLLIFATQSANIRSDITSNEAENAASIIANTAEEIYYMGSPAQRKIKVNFPAGVEAVTLDNEEIVFQISTASLEYNISKYVGFNMTGSIDSYKGPHVLLMSAIETPLKETYVQITET